MVNSQTQKIFGILKRTYPKAKIVLNYGNNWELLVSVILSAQCTDKKVNEVTTKLFRKYPALDDYVDAKPAEFEQDIRQTGFYRNKSKNILAAAKLIKQKFGGVLPKTMVEMLTIPGVARKTANVVLGNAYGVVEGIAVDTHVLRLSQRLRLVNPEKVGPGKKPVWFTKGGRAPNHAYFAPEASGLALAKSAGLGFGRSNDILSQAPKYRDRPKKPGQSEKRLDYYKDAVPEKIEKELMGVVPKKDWFKLTYLLIDHGRLLCKAQNPICKTCPLRELCPVSRIQN